MSTQRKPRGDSVLKTLPPERQAEVSAYAKGHSLEETRLWLAQAGVKTSITALSNFCAWYSWQEIYQLLESNTNNFMEQVKKQRPDLPDDAIEKFGNDFFQLQAIRLQDPELFLKFRTITTGNKLEREKLQLAERRVKLLEAKAAQAEKTEAVLNEPLTPEERERRIKEIYGRA